MVGEFLEDKLKGIISRSLIIYSIKLKKIKKKDPSERYKILIAFIQIYLETIQYLFELKNHVRIREELIKEFF